MLIQSNNFIPQVYSKERDMQVFTTLIDVILSCCKYDIDNLYRLYSAMECPQQFLPYFGDTINYKYDKTNTVTSNRKILDTFMVMMRYKGSEKGIKMAAALGLTSLDLAKDRLETADVEADYISALSNLNVRVDYENARIIIDYPNVYTQVRYLIDYVRPVGMWIDLRSVTGGKVHIPMAILAQATAKVFEYTSKKSEVDIAEVNFSEPYPTPKNASEPIDNSRWVEMIASDSELDDYEAWLSQMNVEDDTIDLNG